MLIGVSSQCMLLIIYSRQNITTLFLGGTLGYTDKLSDIAMILNFFKNDNHEEFKLRYSCHMSGENLDMIVLSLNVYVLTLGRPSSIQSD